MQLRACSQLVPAVKLTVQRSAGAAPDALSPVKAADRRTLVLGVGVACILNARLARNTASKICARIPSWPFKKLSAYRVVRRGLCAAEQLQGSLPRSDLFFCAREISLLQNASRPTEYRTGVLPSLQVLQHQKWCQTSRTCNWQWSCSRRRRLHHTGLRFKTKQRLLYLQHSGRS